MKTTTEILDETLVNIEAARYRITIECFYSDTLRIHTKILEAAGFLTRLLQLVAICFRTIKSWSGFADDLWWRSSKCSANNDILKFFLLLKY